MRRNMRVRKEEDEVEHHLVSVLLLWKCVVSRKKKKMVEIAWKEM